MSSWVEVTEKRWELRDGPGVLAAVVQNEKRWFVSVPSAVLCRASGSRTREAAQLDAEALVVLVVAARKRIARDRGTQVPEVQR